MNYDWPKILAMTGVFLGPILAVVSVIGRFLTRKYRLLLNLLFVPALCVPVALLILGPKLARTSGYDQHVGSTVKPGPWPFGEGEKHLDRHMIAWTALLIMYWIVIVMVMLFEMHILLYKAKRRLDTRRSLLWIIGLGVLSTGVTGGWIIISNAVANSRSGSMTIRFENGSWTAFWANAALCLACWIGMICVLVIPVVKLQDLMYRDVRLEDGGVPTFTENDKLLGNER